MKKRIFSIMDTGKRKTGVAVICAAMFITTATGVAFSANATVGPSNESRTAINDTSPSVIAEQNAIRFEQYRDYSMIYDKATDRLYYNGALVRYFEDYYPIDESSYAGIDYFNENGTIDVHGVRDLSDIIHNADGSHDPSGKLIGVEPYSQAEYNARDIDELKNPPQAYTVYATNDVSDAAPQNPQQNSGAQASNATTYTIHENVSGSQGETFSEKFLKYKDYGVTFDENSINGGIGNVYYQGQLVGRFADITPDGGVFTLSSSDGGKGTARTVYDENGKLTGIQIVDTVETGGEVTSTDFVWPTNGGSISEELSSYPGHTGIDIPRPQGTAIYASATGIVTLAKTQTTGYGKYIVIDHGNGYQTLYAHCNDLSAKVGDEVKAGQPIATVGRSGNATEYQLHFEVRYNEKIYNPKDFLTAPSESDPQ